MDAQLKAKWIEALRSGEYKQAKGSLHDRDTDSYCCLGVLCKVMGAEFGPEYEEKLGLVIADELGDRDLDALILLNDGNSRRGIEPHSFAEIANYIEKKL